LRLLADGSGEPPRGDFSLPLALPPAYLRREVSCDSVRGVETDRGNNAPVREPSQPLKIAEVEADSDCLRLVERKLPGQDLNLDIESQNPFGTVKALT
jgi:hypothetical protein